MAKTHSSIKTLPVEQCFCLVEATGFEPTASWSRTKRATICATPRWEHYIPVRLKIATQIELLVNDCVFAFWTKCVADF